MSDYARVAAILAEWWKRDADPAEVVPLHLGVEWDGTADQLVWAAIAVEDSESAQ